MGHPAARARGGPRSSRDRTARRQAPRSPERENGSTPPPAASKRVAVRCGDVGVAGDGWRIRASVIARPVCDARIEPCDDEVGQQRDDDEDGRNGEDAHLHHRIVALVDGGDDQPANAGQGEHRLDDDGSAEQHPDLDADHRHDRGAGIAQRMSEDDAVRLMPLARRKVTNGRSRTDGWRRAWCGGCTRPRRLRA